jgi:hypothetical protein
VEDIFTITDCVDNVVRTRDLRDMAAPEGEILTEAARFGPINSSCPTAIFFRIII